jgi:hypothetical protein
MLLSQETSQRCRDVFAPELIDAAAAVLEQYGGPDTERVHQALIGLSGGSVARLRLWVDEAGKDPETVLWFGEQPADVRPETHGAGVEWINGFLDRHVEREN